MTGSTERSSPTMAPTKALTTTSNENCRQFARSPRIVTRSPALRRGSRPAFGSRAALDWQSRRAPIRQPVVRAPRFVPVLPQHCDRVERIDAVASAAVRNHLAALWYLSEPSLQLRRRDGQGARDVSRLV